MAFQTPRDVRSKYRMWFDSDHVCVLTIGKTASSAIIEGLIDAGIPSYQAHSLHRAPQEYLFVAGLPRKAAQNLAFRLKTAAWLALTRSRPKRFITVFRDPFARNLSAFFEQSGKLGVDVSDLDTETLIALYDRHGPHDATRTWFADNLTRPFGIDVAAIDLVSRGVQRLSVGPRQFLALKYEDQQHWEEAIGAFTGRSVTLTRRNDSTRKSYADAMARLKRVWRPSPDIVARSLDRPLWDAIYTDAEKETIRARWNIPRRLAP